MKLSLALTLATAAFTSAATLSTRAKGAGNTVHITSASDFCIIAPKGKHVSIGDSETSDGSGELSYCTKPTSGQGQLPSAFLKKVVYKAGSGKGKYVQVTGCINPSKFDRLQPHDGGGQYDALGGDGGRGNPPNSVCTGYAAYVEQIEPDANRFCLRCCANPADCNLSHDQDGCPAVIVRHDGLTAADALQSNGYYDC